MAKRYSKNYSNYILKKKYQYSTKGTIWERDWVTIGAQHQIEKGKRPFFGDSGFLFTDNSFPSTQKRHDFGKVVAEWLYSDVKDAKSFVNQVELNYVSNDLRDFAYYGSCVELVRASVYNIINWFPGCAWKTSESVMYVVEERYEGEPELQRTYTIPNIVRNPFNIDFVKEKLKESDVTNPMRYMSLSNRKYEIICQDNNGQYIYGIADYSIRRRTQLEIENDETNDCNTYRIATVTINGVNGDNNYDFIFDVWVTYGNTVLSMRANRFDEVELRPIESVIDEYFDNLEGFERLLLRTDTVPLYKNAFITMFDTELGYRYAERTYVWPTVNDYCIDIESKAYESFLDSLIKVSTDFDEMWCDNIWRNMTHESLRNYDWTYTKYYTEGEEDVNVAGGNRLEKLLRIYGRVFDDLKRYIDGIKFSTKVSYDGYNNVPDAELSDRLSYCGWEVFSTIPNFEEDNEDLATVYIDYDSIHTDDEDGKPVWFYAQNPLSVTAASCDISFLRSLSISSRNILKAKGTVKSIDMIMALFGIGSDINMENAISYSEYNTMSDEEKEHYELAKEDAEDQTKNLYVRKTLRYKVSERYYTTNMYDYSDEFKKKIADIVHYDNVSWFYDDPYEGVPFGDVELYGKKYIVPFYDKSKHYNGDFAFQSNGGWYKKSLDIRNTNDYEETMSYLNVVPNFESLLGVNTFSLEKIVDDNNIPPSDIYYVVDPSDYINYNEAAPYNLTHYFYIMDTYNPESPDSWKPILYEYVDINDTITPEEYENLAYRLVYTDLEWIAMDCPGETVKNYGALDANYVYICNNAVVRAIDKNDYEFGENLGYSVPDLCKVSNDKFYISVIPFQSTHDYKEMSVSEFEDDIITPGKYVPEGYIWFVNKNESGDQITYDQWRVLTKAEQSMYELLDVELDLALDNGIRSDIEGSVKSGNVCDFDLEKLYYESIELRQLDYTHVIDLYVNDSVNYVPIKEVSQGSEVIVEYARKYTGDVDLYERAKYLDSIISSNIGNNPHVGYGRYDLGYEFVDYMTSPFKYYEDNYILPDEITTEKYTLLFDVDDIELSQLSTITRSEYDYKPWSNTTVHFHLLLQNDSNAQYPIDITIDEYIELPITLKRIYHVDEQQLKLALMEDNRSDTQSEVYSFDLRKLYVSDFSSIYDYTYTINKYKTYNKVKNISDTYIFTDGYTRKIDLDTFESLSEEEQLKWKPLIEVGDDGTTVFTYTNDISVSEYDAMPPSEEKDEYVKTMASISTINKYRDVEDESLDAPDGENSANENESYYLNSKLIVIEFINTNELFKQYFLSVIGKYMMQVIPSTAITVVLFGHEDQSTNYHEYDIDDTNG